MDRSRLVYSTEFGRVCPDCGRPVAGCICPKGKKAEDGTGPADGVVRVRRETKGRGGKTATTVQGVPLGEAGREKLAGEMKRRLGTGGGVRDGVIVIQGDHVEPILAMLRERGWTVKKSGG